MISQSDWIREVEEEEIATMEMLLGAVWIPPTGGALKFPGYFLKSAERVLGHPTAQDTYFNRQGEEMDDPFTWLKKAMGVENGK